MENTRITVVCPVTIGSGNGTCIHVAETPRRILIIWDDQTPSSTVKFDFMDLPVANQKCSTAERSTV